ncbi:MAG: DUF3800 domain-containing protein [Candidatus Zixiibacteriota bacterium]
MGDCIRIYCDESCHLENDQIPVMVLGGVWCPADKCREISKRIREIKVALGHNSNFEIKWIKVSPSQESFYKAILDYFFDDDDLHFRSLVVPDKSLLRHKEFAQDHSTWYYKMFFDLLKVLLNPENEYEIYLDIKDTRSADKVSELHNVLCNNLYDFSRSIIRRVQNVRSHEVEQIQLADLLTGTVAYANRGLNSSSAKLAMVERMRERSGYRLTKSTLLLEKKVNILVWKAKEAL